MLYTIQVYLLVAVPVFALAGLLILALFVWTKLQEYAHARRAMKQIVTRVSVSHHRIPATAQLHSSTARSLGAA
jgi:uncharacterized membrane protein